MATLLCLHETASSSRVWDPLCERIPDGVEVIAPDRLGWGGSEPPEDYRATTVAEQAESATGLLKEAGEPAIVAGAGIGAAIALDVMIRHPELTAGGILIEPPIFAFVPLATEELAGDRVALEEAVREGGPAAGAELYLSGALHGLGPGADRLPDAIAEEGRRRPMSLFAELAAVPSWNLPFAALRSLQVPAQILVSEGTSPLILEAAQALEERIPACGLSTVSGEGPPHIDGPDAVVRAIEELSAA